MAGCPYGQSLIAWSDALDVELVMLLPCRRWRCEHCGTVRAADLSRRIVAANPTKFLTLTVNNAQFANPREAYDKTRRKLPKFTARMRKLTPEFEYVRVLEVTKAGWPHYHLLTRMNYVSQHKISTAWAELTGSPIVDIRQIKNGQNNINYVCKYLKKQIYCTFTERRVSWSRNFFPKDEKTDRIEWELRHKEHRREHPSVTIQEEWGPGMIYQVGPYAWTRTDMRTRAANKDEQAPTRA